MDITRRTHNIDSLAPGLHRISSRGLGQKSKLEFVLNTYDNILKGMTSIPKIQVRNLHSSPDEVLNFEK
jgi:hypothetical protein